MKWLLVMVCFTTACAHLPCTTDLDCWFINGICGDATGYGSTNPSKCMCRWDEFFTPLHQRCERRQDTQVRTYEFQVPVVYQEQLDHQDNVWRSFNEFPRVWDCQPESGYCQSQDNGTIYSHMKMDRLEYWNQTIQSLDHLYGSNQTASISLSDVTYRCQDGLHYRRRNDMGSIHFTTSHEDMRPIYEHCHQDPCGLHGTWINSSICVCDYGWLGTYCQDPALDEQPLPLASSLSYSNFTTCQQETDCPQNQTCWHSHQRCFCKPGYFPGEDGECHQETTLRYPGVPLIHDPQNSIDLQVFTETPQYSTGTNDLVDFWFWKQVPVDIADDFVTIDLAQNLLLWKCSSDTNYFTDLSYLGSVDPTYHCQGITKVCGTNADPTWAPAFDERTNGTCRCDNQTQLDSGKCHVCTDSMYWNGTQCTGTLLECRNTTCSDRGDCSSTVGTVGCSCDQYYLGSNCSLFYQTCERDRCNSRGQCLDDGCECFRGYFGQTCQFTQEECRISRCSGHGDCFSSTHGCICDLGYALANCSMSLCLNGGEMQEDQTCSCPPSFEGSRCELHKCQSYYNTWNSTTNECTCTLPWLQDPTTKRCHQSTCTPWGDVVVVDYPQCDCEPPHIYSQAPGPGCPLPCGNNGTYDLTTDSCQCHPGYFGIWCELEGEWTTEFPVQETIILRSYRTQPKIWHSLISYLQLSQVYLLLIIWSIQIYST